MDDISLHQTQNNTHFQECLSRLSTASEPDAETGATMLCFPPVLLHKIAGRLYQRDYSRAVYSLCHLVYLIHRLNLNLAEIAFMPRGGVQKLHQAAMQQQYCDARGVYIAVKDGEKFYFSRKHMLESLAWYQLILELIITHDPPICAMDDLDAVFSPMVKADLTQAQIKQAIKQLNSWMNQALSSMLIPHHQMTKIHQMRDYMIERYDSSFTADDVTHALMFDFWCHYAENAKQGADTEQVNFTHYAGLVGDFLSFKQALSAAAKLKVSRLDAPLSLSAYDDHSSDMFEQHIHDHLEDFQTIGTAEEDHSIIQPLLLPPLDGMKLMGQDFLKLILSLEMLELLTKKSVNSDLVHGCFRYFYLQSAQNNITQAKRSFSAGKITQDALNAKIARPIEGEYRLSCDLLSELQGKITKAASEVAGILLQHEQLEAIMLLKMLMPAPWYPQILPFMRENFSPSLISGLKDKQISGEFYAAMIMQFQAKSMKITRKGFQGEFGITPFCEASHILAQLMAVMKELIEKLPDEQRLDDLFKLDQPRIEQSFKCFYKDNE